MTNQNDVNFPPALAGEILSNMLIAPEIFFSVLNETGFGIFRPIAGGQVFGPADVLEVPITNPRGYWTLVYRGVIQPSTPIMQVELIKDLVTELNLEGFDSFDGAVTNIYTPIRNSGLIRFTNLSNISSPSLSYYFQTLQIRSEIWANLRQYMTNTLNNTISPRSARNLGHN